MSSTILAAILGFLGSTGLVTFVTYCISRKDKKQEQENEVLKKLDELEGGVRGLKEDVTRTQLVQLMIQHGDEQDNTQEILRVAEYYFTVLKGDWYVSSLFTRWCSKNDVSLPIWWENE